MAVEADSPDAYRANCFVRGAGDDESATESLSDFRRFPAWMWRNTVVVDFVKMAARAQRLSPRRRAARRLLRSRPLQPPRLDPEGDRVPRESRPRGRQARPPALLLLRALWRGSPGLRLGDELRPGQVVRGRRGQAARLLLLTDEAEDDLRQARLERAIGVVYLPQTERISHHFYARMAEQFDAVIHVDQTAALEPLERSSEWVRGEVAETYPSAL